MHGADNTPGRELVAADAGAAGWRPNRARLSADLSRGPDAAPDRVNAALTGVPAVADNPLTSTRGAAAAGPDAMPPGLTDGAVATAVRRALIPASGWRDHDWQFIRDEPQDPALHMALDEVLIGEVAAGRRPPTLRVWEWSAAAVVIGRFQSLRDEVNASEASRLGITVVRRISGGGAMFIEPADTITYSLYAPESLVAGMSYAQSYGYLDAWVIGALAEDLGLSACYQPLNGIASAQGKIGSAAQKRLPGGAVLHHVTMAYDIDTGTMRRVLRFGWQRPDPLRRQTRLGRAEIIDTLAAHFGRRYGFTRDTVTGGELRAARELARVKFSGGAWTALVP